MQIFSINNKASFLISTSQVLFFIYPQDEKVQGFYFKEIELIDTEHRYDKNKDFCLFLRIKIKNISIPYLVQASLFEESLEEVFTILKAELQDKTVLNLPNKSQLSSYQTPYKSLKRLALFALIVVLSLLTYHKLAPPSLSAFKDTSLKASAKKVKGFCSIKAKVAFASENKEHILIKRYCALFGFWKLEDTRSISSRHLQAEFSSKTAQEWIHSSTNLIARQNYAEAFIHIDNALYLEADNERALLYSSQLYILLGEHEKAIKRDIDALKQFPNYASIQQHLALLYQENNNDTAAYKHFLSADKLKPSLKTSMALAQIEEGQGLYQKAIHNYKKAFALRPKDSCLSSTIGLLYSKIKNFKKAGEYLKKAHVLEPRNAKFFLNYYEISFLIKKEISPEETKNFISTFKNNKKTMMRYEMLNIIKLSLQDSETQTIKERWKHTYDGTYLDWSFNQLYAWLEASDLDEEHKYKVKSSIRFFIGYQQAYKLKNISRYKGNEL